MAKQAAKKVAKKSAPKVAKTIGNTYNELKELVDSMADDVDKFDNGTQAAGGRVRKSAQEGKKLFQQLRGEVIEVRKSRK